MVPNQSGAAVQNSEVLQGIINLAQTTACGEIRQPPYGAIILFPGHYDVPTPGSDGTDSPPPKEGAEYFLTVTDDMANYATLITCDNPIRYSSREPRC